MLNSLALLQRVDKVATLVEEVQWNETLFGATFCSQGRRISILQVYLALEQFQSGQ